jgi:hypothetical protein
MKKPNLNKDMAKEYRFDYSKAKPNRLASRKKDGPLMPEK